MPPHMISVPRPLADAANDAVKVASVVAGSHMVRHFLLGQPQSARASVELVLALSGGLLLYNYVAKDLVEFQA
jgi:hypothetical protein